MRDVTAQIPVFQITKMMRAISRWLAARGVVPAVFRYDTREDEMLVVRIEFAKDDDAEAFAGAFRAAVTNRSATREKRRRQYLHRHRVEPARIKGDRGSNCASICNPSGSSIVTR